MIKIDLSWIKIDLSWIKHSKSLNSIHEIVLVALIMLILIKHAMMDYLFNLNYLVIQDYYWFIQNLTLKKASIKLKTE